MMGRKWDCCWPRNSCLPWLQRARALAGFEGRHFRFDCLFPGRIGLSLPVRPTEGIISEERLKSSPRLRA